MCAPLFEYLNQTEPTSAAAAAASAAEVPTVQQ